MSMLLYPQYYRRFGVWQPGHIMAPRLFPLSIMRLPRDSVLHYQAESEAEYGPPSDDLLLQGVPRLTFVGHVTQLTSLLGNPRSAYVPPGPMINEYRRRYRKLRPLNKLEIADREPQNLIVQNYALLPHLYKYIRSFFTLYYTWYNLQATMVSGINDMLGQSNRHNYIQIQLPKVMPSLQQLRLAQARRSKTQLEPFNNFAALNILDFFTWLGKDREHSLLSKLPHDKLDHVDIIFRHVGTWFTVNLGKLDSWRRATEKASTEGVSLESIAASGQLGVSMEQMAELSAFLEVSMEDVQIDAATFQLRVLKMLMALYEASTLAGSDQPNKQVVQEPEAVATDPAAVEEKIEIGHDETKKQLDELRQPISDEEMEELSALDKETAAELDAGEEDDGTEYDEDGVMIINDTGAKPAMHLPPAVSAPKPQVVKTLSSAIEEKVEALADQGLLSAAEYRAKLRAAVAYKSLKDPYGTGQTVEDALRIDPKSLVIDQNASFVDMPQVLDKSMLKSTVSDIDRQYVENVLPKDILNAVMAVQNAGIAVTDYNIERVVDAVSDFEVHSVQLTPAVGRQSTIRFRVPRVTTDGTYMSNGTRYRLKKQRSD